MFGVICLSVAIGILLYWFMFMNVLPRILRPDASRMLPLMSGVVGASCCALLYLAFTNLAPSIRRSSKSRLVLVRSGDRFVVRRSAGEPVVVRHVSPAVPSKPVTTVKMDSSRLGALIMFAVMLGCYATAVFAFGTLTPFMGVPTGSMIPTLNRGDFVLVRASNRIKVGDIIAFHVPSPYDKLNPSPIIHRVVEIHKENGLIYYKTKGDNNPSVDPWMVPSKYVIGVVIWRMPLLGYIILYLRNAYVIALIVAGLVFWTVYPYLKRRDQND